MDLLFSNGSLIDPNPQSPSSKLLDSHLIDSNFQNNHFNISFNDRALQYGDGVFETMRISQGDIPMWCYHQWRLKRAEDILGLPLDVFFSQWSLFVSKYFKNIKSGTAKLIISRGNGPRGYKIPNQVELNWWVNVSVADDSNVIEEESHKLKNTSCFHLTLCQHTLSRQPLLAGLKHLNRLDQVMARSEWHDSSEFDEGIMFNLDGDVVEGTMSNLFWIKGAQIYTPDLTQEGVDGCVRRWVIEKNLKTTPVVIQKNAKLDHLLMSDGVFVTNSLLGIKQVNKILDQIIPQNVLIEALARKFEQQFI